MSLILHQFILYTNKLNINNLSIVYKLMAALGRDVVFEDFFPSMVEKLGSEGFLKELQNGFRVLMDEEREVITFESLKRNSVLLGLEGMSDDELMCMLREGDLDGDGCLNEKEFCVLMVRLSPDLMDKSRMWLAESVLGSY